LVPESDIVTTVPSYDTNIGRKIVKVVSGYINLFKTLITNAFSKYSRSSNLFGHLVNVKSMW